MYRHFQTWPQPCWTSRLPVKRRVCQMLGIGQFCSFFLAVFFWCVVFLYTQLAFQQHDAWASLSCCSCYMSKGSWTWKIRTAVSTDSRWLLHLYLLCTAKYPIALPSFTSFFSGRSLPWIFKIICCTYGPKNGKYFFQERQKLMMHVGRQDQAHSMNSSFIWWLQSFLSSLHFLQSEQGD